MGLYGKETTTVWLGDLWKEESMVAAQVSIRAKRRSMSGAGAVVWSLLLLSACFHPVYDHPACGPNGECPSGLTCNAQLICDRGAGNLDAAPSLPPSCIGLAMTCGASDNDSCCSSPQVTGGMYYRSYDLAGDARSGNMSYPATVSTFRLDKYEVTLGRFRAFINAGMGTQAGLPVLGAGAHANIPVSGWDPSWDTSLVANKAALISAVNSGPAMYVTWTDMPGPNENRPISFITWYEAMAFCAWDGGYLPTEAEWNYAATGGGQQRVYPWLNSTGTLMPLDGSHASYYDGTDCVGDGMPGCAVADLVEVGAKPAGDGRWGQSDLAGNVAEWTLDSYAPYASICTDCADLTATSPRVVRGGAFDLPATYLRTGDRGESTVAPTNRNASVGVRCARAP